MKQSLKRAISVLLSLVMLLSLTVPAAAVNDQSAERQALTWEKVEGAGRATSQIGKMPMSVEPERDEQELVRVSIVLKEDSTLARGYSTRNIAENTNAMNYRDSLKAKQNALAEKISREVLGGAPLDVVWNITLAGNIISANVPYGKLDAIRQLEEVKSVEMEAQYEAYATEDEGDNPEMYRSVLQTGSDKVWEKGITGAGSRVAVIDTGIEKDHISFSAAGLEHSLQLNAEAKGMSYEEYLASLNLLTAADVQAVAEELNVSIDPNTTYISSKIPYAYNYVDTDYDITHRNDTQGNHGSHVEGIAASNKYVVSGDGFAEAANGNNKIKGQAYDAQILTMKVFGKNGGAYDSDYMVAIEDAIVLGADSVNLSLGSASAGLTTSPEYQSILNSLTDSDTVVAISMGNSYNWSYATGTSGRILYYDDVNYFTGGSPGSFANAFTVASVGSANANANGRYSMSSFSSWGVPSDLSLKPEITAPGGNIQSVNGNNTTGYTGMSGTSMAAPQISGIAALVAQYIRENGLKSETLSTRQLAQSLIMSTAVPIHMTNNNYVYYSILDQGAGLARVDKATTSKTYVMIDPDSLPARAPLSAKSSVMDGKVKVELGDDPDYNGVYSFAYTLNNLTDEPVIYELGADFFTQNITGSGNNRARNTTIVMLSAGLSWTVDGQPIDQIQPEGLYDLTGDGQVNEADAQAILDLRAGLIEAIPVNADKADIDGDEDVDTYDAYLLLKGLADAEANENYVTVPANGSVKIGLTFDLKDSIDAFSFNGNYVEGYVNAKEITASGSDGVDHSIPVLGYYGSWTDPSMFNKGSYLEYKYGGEARNPYLFSNNVLTNAKEQQSFLVRHAGDEFGTPIGGNPVVDENYYDADRNAIAPQFGDEIFSVAYSAIRNSAASRFRVMQDGVSEPLVEIIGGSAYGAYYDVNGGAWHNTNAMPDINIFLNDTVANNTKLTLSFELAPEYYVKADGSIDWDALHDGAKLSLPVTVDNEEPSIIGVDLAVSDINGAKKLLFTAKDNQYIASFRLLLEDGTELLSEGSDPNAAPGDPYSISFDISDPEVVHYLVEVTDYALNVGTYRVNLNKEELEEPEITMTLDKDEFEIIGKNSTELVASVLPWGVDDSVTWSTSDPAVATVNGRGVVTGVETGTAVITATSVAYPEVSASATVHVRFIEKTLNGIVCDENGAAFVIEFNMRDLPTYQTLHEEPLSDWVYETAIDRDGTVYVSTYDGSNQSPLYTLDLETMELTQLGNGTTRTYYTDIDVVGDALYSRNLLVGVYNTNLYTINKTNGTRASQISMRNYTGTDSLVGISYYKTVDNVDHFFVLTQAGAVYDVGLYVNEDAVAVQGAQEVLNFGYAADINYWQDLYFDGESLFWSRIDLGISRVDLIMAENFVTNGAESQIIRAGSFAVDVWPVGGLFELSKMPGNDTSEDLEPTEPDYYLFGWINGQDYACEGDSENLGIYKFENGQLTATFDQASYVGVKTGDNANWYMTNGWLGENVSSAILYNTSTLGESADKLYVPGNVEIHFNLQNNNDGTLTLSYTAGNGEGAGQGGLNAAVLAEGVDAVEAGRSINLLAEADNTNGLVTVSYPETATLESVNSSAYHAVKTGENTVVLAYAFDAPVAEGTLIATLTFSSDSYGDVSVSTSERNEEALDPAVVEVVSLAVENPSVPEDPVFGEPVFAWAQDYSMATATFTSLDGSVVRTVVAEITSVRTDPTFTQEGSVVYTATVEFEGEIYTDEKTEILPALGYIYGEPVFNWAEDYSSAEAVFTATNAPEHQVSVPAVVTAEEIPATCTEAGCKIYTAIAEFDGAAYADEKTVEIPALGHSIGEPVFIWSADCSLVFAEFTCENCGQIERIQAAVSAVSTEPTFEADGEIVYTATVEYNGETYTDTRTVILPAKQYSFGAPEFQWTAENTAKAIFTANEDPNHKVELDAEVVEKSRIDATCTQQGRLVLSASVIFQDVLYTDELVIDLLPLGHSCGEPEFIWAEDCSMAYARFTCSRCGETLDIEAEIEKVETPATAGEDGRIDYTACVEYNGETYTDSKTQIIPALGYTYGEPTFVWAEDYSSADAVFTAIEDPTKTMTIPAEVITSTIEPTYSDEGIIYHFAYLKYNGVEYDDIVQIKIPAKGHPSAVFTDVDQDAWYRDGIDYVVDHGMMNGTSATTFDPNGTVNRAMMVTVLYRLAGEPDVTGLENPFSDVRSGKYYYKAVLWANANKITTGTTATTFEPDALTTREQLVTFLYRYAEFAGKDTAVENENALDQFADGARVSKFARVAMIWASENGILTGARNTSGGLSLNPKDSATRAQLAAIFARYAQNVEDASEP